MENARIELLEHIADRKVDLVRIGVYQGWGVAPLRIEGTLDEVLPLLDFEYDSGYGGQKLFGYIWYVDGSWSDRGEYDGSEWWQHQTVPNRTADIDVH